MATQIQTFDVTIPAGTPIAAPVVVDVSFPPMVTEVIHWRVPRGPNGLMGWRLTSGSGQVIPKNTGQWIITDNESATWRLEDLHDSGSWQVTGYNTGTHNHVIRLRFHVSPIGGKGSASGPLAWLGASRVTRGLLDVGQMANAPAVVDLPREILWPPPGR